MLLESTFRDPAMMADTATRFAEAGYRVEVVAVGTPAPVSRLGAEQRYLAAAAPFAARWTPPEVHETALKDSPDVVVALEALPAVARIQVHSREHLLYDNTRTPDGTWAHPAQAADVLRAEQKRALSPADAAQWLARYRAVFDLARERTGYLSPATIPAYRALQADAARLIDIAAAAPAADSDALREEQRRRDTVLRFVAKEHAPGLFGRLRDRTTRREPPEPPAPPHHRPRNEPPSLGL
ncbi:MAG TPA: zeta toxin family protein [Microbacteriaceae bacterium]